MTTGFTHESPAAETVEWYTPAWLFEKLGDEWDLDPCHPVIPLAWTPVICTFNIHDDGLARPWLGRVWMNPPYGPETPAWLAKLAEHGTGMALVFARTDTGWFHEYCAMASGLFFIKNRIKFVDRTGAPRKNAAGKASGPGSGSLLVAYGERDLEVLRKLPSDFGLLVDLTK